MNGVAFGADGAAAVGFRQRPLWGVVLFGLLCLQAATTASLFDAERHWSALCDARPIVSGRHSLHLYHGCLGASSWRAGHFGACFDPAFQAGYPKTPLFDSGSRPAELFLIFGREPVASYKIGVAICCLLVPLVFAAAACLLGLGPGAACGSAAMGQLCWWSGPTLQLLRNGELDWLLAGLLVVLHAALLVRYHNFASPRVCLGLLLTAMLGWLCHPVVWFGFTLVFVPLYVAIAMRHGAAWHLGIWLAWGGGLLINLGWIIDFGRFCWIQMPIASFHEVGISRFMWKTCLTDVVASHADRALVVASLFGGALGVIGLLCRRRPAAALSFGLPALLVSGLFMATGCWKPLELIGPTRLIVLACSLAVVPLAFALGEIGKLLVFLVRHALIAAIAGIAVVIAAGWTVRGDLYDLFQHSITAEPLVVGLNAEQQSLVRTISESTPSESRILWEDRPNGLKWTPLLPLLTRRDFMGGLDHEAKIEHMYARLTSSELAGRPLGEWSDAELEDFARRYNVGYVAGWSPAVVQRFQTWPKAEPVVQLHNDGEGWFFQIKRTPSFVLKGRARILEWNAQRIALADVEPEDGVVILSLHHLDGFRVAPSDIFVEQQPDAFDPIPFLRLRMTKPAMRVTLTWGD